MNSAGIWSWEETVGKQTAFRCVALNPERRLQSAPRGQANPSSLKPALHSIPHATSQPPPLRLIRFQLFGPPPLVDAAFYRIDRQLHRRRNNICRHRTGNRSRTGLPNPRFANFITTEIAIGKQRGCSNTTNQTLQLVHFRVHDSEMLADFYYITILYCYNLFGTASQTSRHPGKFHLLGKPAHWLGLTS